MQKYYENNRKKRNVEKKIRNENKKWKKMITKK